jgi:formate--tetrahydrofolate ligase
MAIFCLSTSLKDLKTRLGNIVIGYTRDQKPVHARDLKVHGAMTVLLKDALQPNLVQTLENNPRSSTAAVRQYRARLQLGNRHPDRAQARRLRGNGSGFRRGSGRREIHRHQMPQIGLRPSAVVIVATVRALKYHGGVDLKELNKENLGALEKGIANLERHVNNVRNHYGCRAWFRSINSRSTPRRKSIS